MQMIGIIGGNGFIGSHLIECLDGININRDNYDSCKEIEFDIIINANGNSKKYWGDAHPFKDFDLSVLSVYKSLSDFKYNKYVYLSSVAAETRDSPYGVNKYLAEEIIKGYCSDYSVVRLPLVIGDGSVKGLVNDVLNGDIVYLTSRSRLMVIDAEEVAMQLYLSLQIGDLKKLERFYPSENITVEEIGSVLDRDIRYAEVLRDEYYDYTGDFKSSKFYINKYR